MVITAFNNLRLSRRLLWLVILLYSVPGLISRSPWKPEDAIGFGQAFAFATQPFSSWALSSIGDRPFAQQGLLSAWLAGLLGKLGLWLGVPLVWIDDLMRLGNVVWLIVAGWALWNTTYRLARRVELQPEDPLGAAPTRVDYARSVADASLLCLLATLGLLVRSHMQVAELAELAGISILLLGAVRALDRPIGAGWMLGWGLALSYFARGWSHCVPFLLLLILSSATHNSLRFGLLRRMLRAFVVFGALFGAWFFWLISQKGGNIWWEQWNIWNVRRFLLLDPDKAFDLPTLIITLKTMSWFLWPILPMSIWTAWRYHRAFAESSIRIPFAAAAAGLLILFITNPADEANYFPLLAPLCVLAAIGLSTMRRGLVSLIDWFAVLCFTFGAVLVWLGWSAATFGFPEKLAQNFEKLSPGYMPEIIGWELALALVASYAWFRLIVWRTRQGPSALWRPMILSSGGITLIWLLLMTLWIPRIDYAKRFESLGVAIRNTALQLGQGQTCVIDYNLGFAQRATLEYHAGLRMVREARGGKSACKLLLLQDDLKRDLLEKSSFETLNKGTWHIVWAGNRNSDRHERFYLYSRD